MGDRTLSAVAYRSVESRTKAAGSTTFAGLQRHREGRGLDPLVDPKGFGLIRRSISRFVEDGDRLVLARGVAMLEETRLDTTGSMGHNVAVAFRRLPKTYELLAEGEDAVLGRYDTQMITSIFGDVCDSYVLCRSQAEMDEKIAEQMTMMVPEGGGGDSDEDPQYGLFGAAYLTKAAINDYGLKYYDFTISDARGRFGLDRDTLIRVFGETVFETVAENGHQINPKKLPDLIEVVRDLKKRAHAFFLQVGNNPSVTSFWTEVFGDECVVVLPNTELLPQVKAAIIGLTEGVLDLQSVEDYLVKHDVSKEDAKTIARSLAKIPIGAQAELPNFDKIPPKGSIFANKGDLWPIAGVSEASLGGDLEPELAEAGEGDKIWG